MKNLLKVVLGIAVIVSINSIAVSKRNEDSSTLIKSDKDNENNNSVAKKSDNNIANKLLDSMKDIFDAFCKGCDVDATIDARTKNNNSNDWVAKYARFMAGKQDVTQELYEFILNNIKVEIIAQLARRGIYLQIKEKDPISKVTECLLKQLSDNLKNKQYKTCLNILNCFDDICDKAKHYIGYFLQDIKNGNAKIYKADDKDMEFVKKHKDKLEALEKSISNLKKIARDLSKENSPQSEELSDIAKEISRINNNLLNYLENIKDILKEYGIDSEKIVNNRN